MMLVVFDPEQLTGFVVDILLPLWGLRAAGYD